MTNLRLGAVLITAFALAACGGGGSHSASSLPTTTTTTTTSSSPDLTANAPHNSAPAAGAVSASVTVQIPLATQTAATKRRPQYLTTTTQGIDLQAFQSGTYSGYVFYPLTASQTNCKAAGATLTCVLGIQAPVGSSQIITHTYDNTTVATSNMLSVSATPVTIVAGQVNTVAVTTLPVVSQFTTSSPPSLCLTEGSPQTGTFTYTATDADGGALTGLTLANPLTLSNGNPNDATPGFTISPSTITTGSGTITTTYNGTDPNMIVVQISMPFSPTSASPTSTVATQIVPVTGGPSHYVYFSDKANNQLNGFDFCASANTNFQATGYGLPAGTSPNEIKYDRHSTTNDPRIFVGGSNNTLLWVDIGASPANGAAVVLQTLTFAGPVKGFAGTTAQGASQLYVTYGGATANTLALYTVNETAKTMTLAASNSTLPTTSGGVSLNGAVNSTVNGVFSSVLNEGYIANGPANDFLAFNPTTLAIDATVTAGGAGSGFGGPNSNVTCSLVLSPTSVSAYAVQPPGSTSFPQIGTSITTPSAPKSQTFFAGITGPSANSNVALVTQNGGASLVSCDGVTFTNVATWTSFVSNPTAVVQSNYTAGDVGSLIYVVGSNSGTYGASASGSPWFAAYSQYSSQPVTFNNYSMGPQPPNPANFTSVTAGL